MKLKKRARSSQSTSTDSNTTCAVYREDLGTHGTKIVNNWDKPKSIGSFTVTSKESKRRKHREVSLILLSLSFWILSVFLVIQPCAYPFLQ
jgi:hypothetical protein